MTRPEPLPAYVQHAHDVGDVVLHTAASLFLHEVGAHCVASPVKAAHASVACVRSSVPGATQS
jgi:hypothetical protein